MQLFLSTKTLYNYIHQGLLEIKVIDLPRAVRIRKKFTKRPSTKKHLGKSIEERQKKSIIVPVLEIGKSILFWVERQ